MPFLELSLTCRESEQPRYAHALADVGALAVTMLDADAGSDDEHAILEPGVGETPLWNTLTLSALFADDADALLLLAALDAFDPALDWSGLRFRHVADQDWERAWMDQYVPLRFGARTWIVPWNCDLPDDAQALARDADDDSAGPAIVRLDPGLAFGSGTHPTTSLCLQWLDALASDGALRDATVLDFGCGSGILALAALKLGAVRAVGVDNDPQALLASHDNAQRNGVADALRVYLPRDEPVATYPVVVANILASALAALADTLAARVAVNGRIALSGILDGQQDALIARYGAWFDALHVTSEGDWVRIDGRRR
ncbi:MAG: 50S ribosomal protein L11 methyltransferase [Luteimonas sp.]